MAGDDVRRRWDGAGSPGRRRTVTGCRRAEDAGELSLRRVLVLRPRVRPGPELGGLDRSGYAA